MMTIIGQIIGYIICGVIVGSLILATVAFIMFANGIFKEERERKERMSNDKRKN